VFLVGCDDGLQQALRPLLRSRGLEPLTAYGSLETAHESLLGRVGESFLLVVHLASDADVARLRGLCTALPGQPVLALLSPGGDMSRLVAAMRAGAGQVVPLPLAPDDFLGALDVLGGQLTRTAEPGRVLAVCGVTGGCGATTLALNLAHELAWRSSGGVEAVGGAAAVPSCLLVELARQMGTLATYLDLEPSCTTRDLLADPSKLTVQGVRWALAWAPSGLAVLAGPYQDLAGAPLSSRGVFQLVDLCRRLAPVVVLDVPCTFDEFQFETLALAEAVLLVGVQSVSSVRALKLLRDTLEREEGIQGMRLVVNRYNAHLPGFGADRLAELLHVEKVWTVAADYPAVTAAANHGRPLRLAVPHSRILADIATLATAVSQGIQARNTSEGTPARSASEGTDGQERAPLRVLHVEDDPVQQQVMALYLGALPDLPCSVQTAVSEQEAVERFQKGQFDVVLLDYHLAEGNGLSCLRRLRQLDPVVPILAVSGQATPQVAAALLEAGADDFLSKEGLSAAEVERSLCPAVERAARLGRQALPDEPARLPDGVEAWLEGLRKGNALGAGRFSAAQIQRTVDLVLRELRPAGPPVEAFPRRLLLALFMRLFGGAA
jgi:pilus assembly protein CpaE